MNYAAAHPERVDKLILLDSTATASEFMDAMADNILMFPWLEQPAAFFQALDEFLKP
jgi:hypothetical protein